MSGSKSVAASGEKSIRQKLIEEHRKQDDHRSYLRKLLSRRSNSSSRTSLSLNPASRAEETEYRFHSASLLKKLVSGEQQREDEKRKHRKGESPALDLAMERVQRKKRKLQVKKELLDALHQQPETMPLVTNDITKEQFWKHLQEAKQPNTGKKKRKKKRKQQPIEESEKMMRSSLLTTLTQGKDHAGNRLQKRLLYRYS